MKKLIAIVLVLAMLVPLCACGEGSAEQNSTAAEENALPASAVQTAAAVNETAPSPGAQTEAEKTEEPAIRPLTVARQMVWPETVDGIEGFSDHWFGNDMRIKADLSSAPGLAYSLSFADNTVFPSKDKLPAGFDPKELLEWGKYPGLNVDILHEHGFTGKGAVIAYVDQELVKHEQYSGTDLHYTNNSYNPSSMHGPTVLSMLAGKDTGTAPEATVYYYAQYFSMEADQKYLADCLYQIIEQNKELPDDGRIRMVGFSNNVLNDRPNVEMLREAVKACEDAGIMVWFCGEYSACAFVPGSDKNDPDNIMPNAMFYDPTALVHVPASGRTGATGTGSKYIYWMSGGVSWTMPYVLGLYAIAIEIDPTLTQDELRKMIVDTAYVNASGMKIVDPVSFVSAALCRVGRDEEAQAMLDEVKARTKYLYAVMDTAAMSEEDLTAVGDYLAAITDKKVLIVDAAGFSDAKSLYAAMRQDAEERGGTVAGVQIFGTPSMVPSFSIMYKVQMETEVDEGGTLLTDLFYGNFENDPDLLTAEYNVMEHMAEGWDIDLIPQWPVARLPLSKGEFSAFFEKYDSFVLDTGLERLDIVNFSNPIFEQINHTDDWGLFLKKRMDGEFRIMDVPYRLYGNLKGNYPVRYSVLGGFEAENLSAENEKGPVEFLINTHGQWDNLDNAIFVKGEEQRISLVNMENINTVLAENPYYLDTWACSNGTGMADNLTTTALNGQCVGMFSATAILSNNGIYWNVSLSEMTKSNPFYFYYNYLKALHEGASRSVAFFTAQREYGLALLEHGSNWRPNEANYQFNLYNLLAYHNFGVMEPNPAAVALCETKGYIGQAPESVSKPVQSGGNNGRPNEGSINLTDGEPTVEPKEVRYVLNENSLKNGDLTIHSYTMQKLDNGYTRFTVEYTAPAGLRIFIFDPPDGEKIAKWYDGETTEERSTLVFDFSEEEFAVAENGFNINFFTDDDNRCFVFCRP